MKPRSRSPIGAEVDEIFGPSRKHIHERKEWVAVAKVDDRESGDGPLIDLNSGVAILSGAGQPGSVHPPQAPSD
ncbi:hypothetical protein [Nocardia brasiliensis]|uniref:hypothetical protein n=1 Tax=Nocardia brasiliensis TaxID=37326 RepID=UPI003671BA3D